MTVEHHGMQVCEYCDQVCECKCVDALRLQVDILKAELQKGQERFCEAISTWFRCIEEANLTGRSDHGKAYYKHLQDIEVDIQKSALLARLLYGNEKLRKEPCPLHEGRWSGIEWRHGDESNVCPHGCGLTGWLPLKEELNGQLQDRRDGVG